MTRQETGIIMDILTAAYPRFYAGKDDTEQRSAMELWSKMFVDDDVEIVAAAVKALICTDLEGYPPHIGAVKAKIRLLTQPPGMGEAEAWALVAKAIRNSGYESREEFDKLPPEIQRLVGSPNQLKDWSQMDSEVVHSVVASNFQRAWRQQLQRRQEVEALPGDIRAMIGGLAERMALHD